MKTYPVKNPSSAPATGRMLYNFVLNNLKFPASISHNIWYTSQKLKLENPKDNAFRGLNKGWVNLKTISNTKIQEGEFAKKQTDGTYYCLISEYKVPIFVSDLTKKSIEELRIPTDANLHEKVYNPNFKKYELLDEHTKYSSELAALSVPKSISSYFGGVEGKINYSEKDVAEFLDNSLRDLSSPKMALLLHGTHMAWCALAYMRDKGNVAGDIRAEFYGQNAVDFYMKDVGSILPSVFYMSALLGVDDANELTSKIDTEIYGAFDIADKVISKVHGKGRLL